MLGAGAVSLGVATGFEVARRNNEADARDAASQVEFKSELDGMERNQTMARVFAGIGAGLLLGGGVLLLFNQRVPSAEPRDAAAAQLALGCHANGCGALAQGTF
jgi:hypothetical protein